MVAFLFACQAFLTLAEFFLWPLVGIGVYLLFGHPHWGQEVLLLAGLLLGLSSLAESAIDRWGPQDDY